MSHPGTEAPTTQGANHWTHRKPHLLCRGESHAGSKLTEAKVIAMRKAHADGAAIADIAIAVGVVTATAYRAIVGINWRHVR